MPGPTWLDTQEVLNACFDSTNKALKISGSGGGGTGLPVDPLTLAAAGTAAIGLQVTGDTVDRWKLVASGTQTWGPGNAAADVTLARSGTGILALTGGMTISTTLGVTGIITSSGGITMADAKNIVLNTTTGTQIGTATTQKLGFFGATPVVQEAGSNDVLASLVTLGLRAASSNPPLNLGTGALTAGTTSVGALTSTSIAGTGTVALTGDMTITDTKNIIVSATTGTKIGTATTQKLGFFNATPTAQIAGSTDVLAGLVTLGFRAASSNPPLDIGSGALGCGTVTLTDAANIVVGSTTGTKIGTATTQKIGFFNATPVVQLDGATDLLAGWVTLGLRAASNNPPLNLGTGAITCGNITPSGDYTTAPAATGTIHMSINAPTGQSVDIFKVQLNAVDKFRITSGGGVTMTTGLTINANNITTDTSTGVQVTTATNQKLAFHGSTAVVQRSGAAQAAVATTSSTSVTPFGYTTSAQADAIVTLVNELRAAMVEKGLIKGSA